MPFGDDFCTWMNTCEMTSHRTQPMLPSHARRLTEHLVEFLAEWILMALEPARAITKTRAPDFLFLHEKDFWFKQIWVDLHQTMVPDREGSYTRPVLGLVVCGNWADGENLSNQNEDLQLALFCLHLDGTVRCPQLQTYEHGRPKTHRAWVHSVQRRLA